MKKFRIITAALALLLVLPMTACDAFLDRLYEPGYARLPENYLVFEVYDMEIAPDRDVMAFDYNGRSYVQYSDNTRSGSMKVRECLGCLSLSEEWSSVPGVQEDMRVLSLSDNEWDDYLLVKFVPTLMAPPTEVFRALDTRGKEIETPKIILPPDPEDETETALYDFWNSQSGEVSKESIE